MIIVRGWLTFNHTGNIYDEGIANDQEIPAVYLISAFNNLYFYFGNSPFNGEPVENTKVVHLEEGFWDVYDTTTFKVCSEKWMAFVDDIGWGVGVYSVNLRPSTSCILNSAVLVLPLKRYVKTNKRTQVKRNGRLRSYKIVSGKRLTPVGILPQAQSLGVSVL
jgi:hypothetical protein